MNGVHALGHPDSPLPQTRWSAQPGPGAAGASFRRAMAAVPPSPCPPNQPGAPALNRATNNDLTVSWVAPGVDNAHSAANTFSLRYSRSGAGSWTILGSVISPHNLTGLAAGTAYDVQVRAANSAGIGNWSATTTVNTGSVDPYPPNAPAAPEVAPAVDGTVNKLTVRWTAPTVDDAHGAATGYNIRTSPHGANTWSVVNGVTSPCMVSGLSGATVIDIQVQATNAAPSPGPWSATGTGRTWGAKVALSGRQPPVSQVHGTSVASSGGMRLTAIASPTAVAGTAFAWSASATNVPTSGLIAAVRNEQKNGWGQSFNAPPTAGTYYLWSLALDPEGTTTGALVSGAITVT